MQQKDSQYLFGETEIPCAASSQRAALFWGFLDLSRPWESVDRIYEKGLVVGWSTSTGYGGEVLAIPKDRLEN